MGKDRDPGDQTQSHQQPSSRPISPDVLNHHTRDPKMQAARVRLPDGQFKEFELNRGSEGEILFRQVTADLSIEEREYFSLCFYDKDEGARHWLYNDKKILRQLKGLPWEFSFEVKFYPTTPTTLVDDHARYYLFLQLRRDILTGRLPATSATHALLGSFVAQIEYGDAPHEIGDDYEKFIVNAKLVPDSEANSEMYKQIAELHRELRAQTTSEAENLYLDHCKQLALYGIHSFVGKDKDTPITIGIGAAGINIYKDEQLVNQFGWQHIIKISYRKSTFSIKLKAGTLKKNETTVVYRFVDYVHAKRVWKCAVEHHTFFRLIQPDDKSTGSFFNFGSQRFRYHGRTQFQTKMASQMFDRPSNVERSPSAMSQPIESGRQVLTPLHYTDTELEHQNVERYRRHLTPKSYTHDDTASLATFDKYGQPRSRPTTLLISTSYGPNRDSRGVDDALSYSPRTLDTPQSSGAAYYMSERSSLRTPSSAYYPASEHTPYSSGLQSPSDGNFEKQHRGEYHVEMRSKSHGGARRNLFGRSSGTSNDAVKLVSFHEPVDHTQPMPQTYRNNELPEIPIERIVQVYHEGHYERLSPRRTGRPDLPYGFGVYTPRNGVTHVDNLEPNNEMDQQPIRFFVDVRHSGISRRDPAKRISHPGKEDVKEIIDPKDYEFPEAAPGTIYRTELAREISPANIKQYTRIYHSGDSCINEPSTSTRHYRLITHVHPLAVSNRNGRDQQASSNVNATISQREQVVSTRVRRESPDSDRRVRLSASVDRSGNLTDTTEDESAQQSTSKSTVIMKKTRTQRLPPSVSPITTSRYKDLREGTAEHNIKGGPIDETTRESELDHSPIADHATVYHHGKSWIKDEPVHSKGPEEKKKKAVMHVKSPKKEKISEPVEPETREVRLIARIKPDQEEEPTPVVPQKAPKQKESSKFGFFKGTKTTKTVKEVEKYPSSTEHYTGPLDSTNRNDELENIPFDVPTYSPKKIEKVEMTSETVEEEPRRYRLIARLRHEGDEDEVDKSNIRPESYGFASTAYEGPLDETTRESEFDHSPISDHATVYHHGKSWIKDEPAHSKGPEEKKKKAVMHVKSPKKEKISEPVEPETREVRLIARIKPDQEEEPTPVVPQKAPKQKESSKFGFFKGTKTTKTVKEVEKYPSSTEHYTGPLDSTIRNDELENIPFDVPTYSPKKIEKVEMTSETVEEEPRRYRLIARLRHEGDEDEVDKSNIRPESYGFASTAYEGPLDETTRESELDHSPIADHATVYHHGKSWIKDEPAHSKDPEEKKKKAVMHVKSPKKEKISEPVEPETREVRLIARIKPDQEEEPTPVVPQKAPKQKESSKFGFFKGTKTTKTVKEVEKYPSSTEHYTGPLDSTNRNDELENIPFDVPTYSPKKIEKVEMTSETVEEEPRRYRLIARLRHEGDEDEVDKSNIRPESYGFASTAYEGPLDETTRESELDHSPIADHATVYHHGKSWIKDEPAHSKGPEEKKKKAVMHVKSPKKEKISEPVEPETREVRLIARIKPDQEEEPTPVVPQKAPKQKESSKFGFFKGTKTTKTVKEVEKYPSSTEHYTGPLDSTNRNDELENIPFDVPTYSPKKIEKVEMTSETVEEEPRRYRLIARLRHEGDEDEVDKSNIRPESYGFASTAYEGPLDETTRESELDHSPIADHATVYHHGKSWIKDEPAHSKGPEEKKKKAVMHVKSPKKEKISEPVEPETREVRLIARIKPDQEEEPTPVVPQKAPKQKESSKFGFFKGTKTTKTVKEVEKYPSSTEHYTGPLDSTIRNDELENIPFDVPTYSPKKIEKVEMTSETVEEEPRRYRLIARLRHEGDEDEVDKSNIRPESYGFASTAYEGPLDETTRESELDHSPIADHATVYHHGKSWIKDEPAHSKGPEEKKKKAVMHVKSPKKEKISEPVEPETREVRLIARIKPDQEEEPTPVVPQKAPKQKESSKFGFFKGTKTTKTVKEVEKYPSSTEHYTGPLDSTNRNDELENIPFDVPTYSPKKIEKVEMTSETVEEEPRRYRLIARLRHEGDEDEVDKSNIRPESYGFASTAYEGPLDETTRESELDHSPISDHATVYHHGKSWIKDEPAHSKGPEEKKKKAVMHVKSPKKEKISEPVEPETREVRLIARIKPDQEEEPTPVVPQKAPKQKESSKFGFFKGTKTTKTVKEVEKYPSSTEHYTGPLDSTIRNDELENIPFDVPTYSPKKIEKVEMTSETVEEEPRRYRLIARLRHEGDEDEVDKSNIRPESYGFASTAYEGPLDETTRESELDHSPISDHATVYHHGKSWIKDEPAHSKDPEEKKKKAVMHVKSPKKEKISEPVEPETREVRLIARIKPDQEEEPTPVVPQKAPKQKESSKFGFFKGTKTTKTVKEVEKYPSSTEHYTGPLDSTNRNDELENIPFDVPTYSPKKIEKVEMTSETVEEEPRRYRLIARLRHEGDEDEVDKSNIRPESYGFASTAYEGPLDETTRESELDHSPIADHATVYHHGKSWIKDEPAHSKGPEEKKKKAVMHVKSPKKEKISEPVEPETREVRLIARIKPDQEEEPTPVVPQKAPKQKESSKFGFFKGTKTTKTVKEVEKYPSSTEHYTGPLDSTIRNDELENIPFDVPTYSPKKIEKVEMTSETVEEEPRRYRLIARLRHEGDEDEVDKSNIRPESYGFASTAYEGPLDETTRESELDHSPIADHATVYHHGKSWIKDEPAHSKGPEEKQKKAVMHVKSPKKEKISEPVEPETREVRLIARIKPDQEEEPTPVVPQKAPKQKESSKFGFFKGTKTTKTVKEVEKYPSSTEHYTGPLDSTIRNDELENIPFDVPTYSPKKIEKVEMTSETVEEEPRRYRLIARLRHEGDEDEVDKSNIRPESYGFASTAYEGPLDETTRESELDHSPISDHATVYHHGKSWIKDEPAHSKDPEEKKKKAVMHVKSPKKEKISEPVEPETREVRLIARIKPDQEEEPTPVVPQKAPKQKESSKFGFFKGTKTTKTVKEVEKYPSSTEHYTGPLDSTIRNDELENIPFDVPTYSPKKIEKVEMTSETVEEEPRRYRLIARLRHEGDEDEVDKSNIRPESYGFASTAYEGPLDETTRESELDHSPISDHATVYHHGKSWIKDEPAHSKGPEEKKKKAVMHVKSPKKEKISEPVEPETREVRLIARIKPDQEEEPTPVVPQKAPKQKESSKFGFFKGTKTTKTVKEVEKYPSSTEHYTGPLDSTIRNDELENIPFDVPTYSPKKIEKVEMTSETVEEEPRRYRLIARLRHEGDEDEVDKSNIRPESYGFASTAYEGPLDETTRESELDHSPISDHATVYHHGKSWIKDEPAHSKDPEEKKKKAVMHVKSPKKEKISEPVEPETREVRLIARIKPDQEEEPTPVVPQKAPKQKESSKFGFFKGTKTTKTVKEVEKYPSSTEHYTGPLDSTNRNDELENIPFDVPTYSPKKIEKVEMTSETVEEEPRRYRLIARLRHEGDEDEVDKSNIRPESYGFASTAYEGPLDETTRESELDHSPISDHATVYHHGKSWIKDEPAHSKGPEEKKKKAVMHVKSPKKEKISEPVEPETREVRLIARIKPDQEEEPTPVVPQKAPKQKESSKFGFFKGTKTTKTVKEVEKYPSSTEHYTGPLDSTIRNDELENIPFDVPTYSPKKIEKVEMTSETVEEEPRRYRLIARLRHEGDEDEVDKSNIRPESYGFASTAYEGPLDETTRESELDHSPISDHATVYHHGKSWIKDEPAHSKGPEEKKKKAVMHVKSPKKEKISEPVEPETREVRLIARIKPDQEEEPTPVVPQKAPKQKESSKFGFFKGTKTTKTVKEVEKYPSSTEHYTGPLDSTNRNDELENIPFDVPTYSPKKIEKVEMTSETVEEEPRRYRLIARLRHEGDEDEVDKSNIRPESYGFASTAYEGPLDETTRESEFDHSPISDHATVYHHGKSWIKDEPAHSKGPEEKKKKAVMHVKSPKKEKISEPVEPETREVRLIARIKPDQEEEPTPVVPQKAPKQKESSKFGFFKGTKTTKTVKEVEKYPSSTEHYTGPLDSTIRNDELENIPFDVPTYSPKKIEKVAMTSETVEEEPRRYRLIARLRHEGDEDEVDKSNIRPESYGFASTAYEGPLDETTRESEFDHSPISDHATVYHHGKSWIKDEPAHSKGPEEKKKKAVMHVKSPKKEKISEPVEPETREVRLIARIKPDQEEEPTPVVPQKAPKQKESSKFGFFKGTKTTKTVKEVEKYPSSTEHYTGPLDSTIRNDELENIPFDVPTYSPKKIEKVAMTSETVEEEPRRYRLIARLRHEGDEDEVDKSNIRPESYGFASTAYEGPLDETTRESELDHSPIADHATVYHHGKSWIKDEPAHSKGPEEKKKKAVMHVKSPKKEKISEPVEPETREVRLIARIKPDQEEEPTPVVPQKAPKQKESSKFGFFKGTKTTKTVKEVEKYPSSTEHYTGPLDSTNRNDELENIPFDVPTYSPKKIEKVEMTSETVEEEPRRYRLIARLRHEGDEDEVDKSNIRPESYGFASTAYEGPLDETTRESELDHSPISDHATVYHHGKSWIKDEPAHSKGPEEKKKKAVMHVKSPKKEKISEPVEPETREVRLIARIKPDQEEEPTPVVPQKAPKQKESSKFGFFKGTKTTKTVKEVEKYPSSTEHYTGPLDSTNRNDELENIPFDVPTYSPKKIEKVAMTSETVEEEPRRYRLIARLRHEGDEDEVDKSNIRPESYGFASTAYEGPLDETTRESELDHSPIADHATVYHHGKSWIKDEPAHSKGPEEKKKKAVMHVKSPKKEKISEPVEPETREVRLIARIKPDQEEEPTPVVPQKAPKQKESSKFGFFKGTKTTKTVKEVEKYPSSTEHYTGPLDSTNRNDELENIPFDVPTYSPKKIEKVEMTSETVEEEPRRYRLIARLRHEGDEDEVDKSNIRPESYGFASTAYEGPLDETTRESEFDHSPISDHATVYHHGKSWIKDEPAHSKGPEEKKKKAVMHVKSPKKEKISEPVEPETREVRLIARIKPDQEEEPTPVVPQKAPKQKESSKFGFFKGTKTTKTVKEVEKYPSSTEHYTGPLDSTNRNDELENIPFDVPTYSPKKIEKVEMTSETVEEEPRRYRLIARLRHEGDEDEVDKSNIRPESYGFASTAYEGPLDETTRESELDHSPISDHATVYHHGKSWIKDEPAHSKDPEEKKKKAVMHVKSPKKEKISEPVEPETREVRLIARIKPDQEEEPTPVVPQKAPKQKESSKFGFFKGTKTTKTVKEVEKYPSSTEHYTGPLDSTNRNDELENIPFDVPTYSPKKIEKVEMTSETVEEEPRRYRLIARLRHEGDEDEVDKSNIRPESYGFASTAYEGPLDETTRESELDHSPISDHATVYHHGKSWIKDEPAHSKDPEEKKKKAVMHVKSPKKEKISEPVEPETREVRLIARIKPDQEEEPTPVVPQKAPKQKESSKFGFFKGTKTTKTVKEVEKYPSSTEHYTGPLDSTNRNDELENIPFDVPTYSPKKIEKVEMTSETVEEEPRRYRLIARLRHEGDEDEVDKSNIRPESYGFASTAYEGPLDETTRESELDHSPIADHATVYHHGKSWIKEDIPENVSVKNKQKEVTSKTKTIDPRNENNEVRLIARVLPIMKEKSEERDSKKTKSDTSGSRAAFWRNSPTLDSYPNTATYSGDVDLMQRSEELEHRSIADLVGPSTSRDNSHFIESSLRYFPSSLHYEPRAARIEGYTENGLGYVEVRIDRRAEVQLEPVYILRETTTRNHAYLSTASAYFSGSSTQPHVCPLSEDEAGIHFSSTPPPMSPPDRSFLARLGFKRGDKKKKEKKKGKKENDSSETSDSEHDEKREFAVVGFEKHEQERKEVSPVAAPRNEGALNEITVLVTSGRKTPPVDLGNTKIVRHETREQQFRLTGDGYSSGFNPNDPSLMSTIQRAERINASSPRLEHAERTFTVRANAPIPVSIEESGQPYTTVSTWQESNDQPEQVEVYTDDNGRQITRTIKSSQVKHTVQTQSFQNYIVDGDQVPVGVADVQRSREQLTPLGQQGSSNGQGIVETQTRTMTYDSGVGENVAPPGWAEEGLGEYVSSKSVTQGNRTIETITYKTEKDGIIETHVEHRVTIHSDGDIDHDAELSHAILEATQMNPDMVVEKIEVRQETNQ